MKNKMQMLINIISNPKVILLDEPLTSLDIVVQEEMKKLLKSLKKDHIIIFSTHILEIALDLCDEIVILNKKNLEVIEKEDLNTKKYKDKIIESLKEENNV
jgi:ABC-2 type transport system ATP-binding protein